ncbi:hypothetical protein CRG98_032277 [Punica granatum]|uniref:Uncharacterized protein n=1 Tax=Punica granatum TaxID=22663 RepID=A0A2I0IV84_PUNGR|nr:hypothetical protein CRG98_032277 [Punica granatum]
MERTTRDAVVMSGARAGAGRLDTRRRACGCAGRRSACHGCMRACMHAEESAGRSAGARARAVTGAGTSSRLLTLHGRAHRHAHVDGRSAERAGG